MSHTNWRSFIADAKTHAHDPQQLTEQQILMEGTFSRLSWEFCKYLAGYISGVLIVVVVFFVWLATATVLRPIAAILGFMGDVPMLISEMIREIKKAQQIYNTKKELSPEEIQRVKAAAQRVYNSLGARGKSMVTRYSNRLSSMDLSSPQSQDEAAKMVIALKDIVARKEAA
jgi:hypothetical protein